MKPVRITEEEMRLLLGNTARQPLKGKGRVGVSPYKNKLEERYAGYLEQCKLAGEVYQYWYEPFGIKLAEKTYYHPDFLVQLPDGTLEIHETKGFMRDDAAVKIKTAARKYPCYVFRLVRWEKRQWHITEIAA